MSTTTNSLVLTKQVSQKKSCSDKQTRDERSHKQAHKTFTSIKRMRGKGFEPLNLLKDRILSPARLTTSLPSRNKKNKQHRFYKRLVVL